MTAMITWRPVKPKDLADAHDYLTLRLADPALVDHLVTELQQTKLTLANPDNVLRAFRLQPLPADDPRVQRKRARAAAGKSFTPILAVQWAVDRGDIVQSYHELCVAYYDAPFTQVPVLLARAVTP